MALLTSIKPTKERHQHEKCTKKNDFYSLFLQSIKQFPTHPLESSNSLQIFSFCVISRSIFFYFIMQSDLYSLELAKRKKNQTGRAREWEMRWHWSSECVELSRSFDYYSSLNIMHAKNHFPLQCTHSFLFFPFFSFSC